MKINSDYCFIKHQIKPFTDFMRQYVVDPRDKRGKKFEIEDLVNLIIIGLMIGKNDLTAISNFYKENKGELGVLLGLEEAPSHGCLNNLINSIDADDLEVAFEHWVRSFYGLFRPDILAGDGTFVRGAEDKIHNGRTPNIVNFVSSLTDLVVANERVMGKGGNETEGFIEILLRMDLKDYIITADCLNNTIWIMDYICENGGDFFFPVKNDKKDLKRRIIKTLLEEQKRGTLETYHQGLKLEHGRLTDRWVYVTDNLKNIRRRDYPNIKQIGLIESTLMEFSYNERNEKIIDKVDFKYYGIISSFNCSAKEAGMIKLKEWKVESFHWSIDNFFDEDRSTIKNENGIFVMAILRRVAYNYLTLLGLLVSDLNCKTLRQKQEFLDGNREILACVVTGFRTDYPQIMQDYYQEKAQYFKELGPVLDTRGIPSPLVLHNDLDLLDFLFYHKRNY